MASDLLSSDILEQQFGPTEVEVLRQDNKTRIIRTRVSASGQILELSLVAFARAGAAEFPEPHQEVVSGKSMGKAFREHGVSFKRVTRFACRQALPESFGRQFGSNQPANVVGVSILIGPQETPYAEILETYSPQVRWPRPGGEPEAGQLANIQLLGEFLRSEEAAQAGGKGNSLLGNDI